MIPTVKQEQEQNMCQGDYESFYLPFQNDKQQLALKSSRTKRLKSANALETRQEEHAEWCIEETNNVNILNNIELFPSNLIFFDYIYSNVSPTKTEKASDIERGSISMERAGDRKSSCKVLSCLLFLALLVVVLIAAREIVSSSPDTADRTLAGIEQPNVSTTTISTTSTSTTTTTDNDNDDNNNNTNILTSTDTTAKTTSTSTSTSESTSTAYIKIFGIYSFL